LAEVGPRNGTGQADVAVELPQYYSSTEKQITGFQIPGKAEEESWEKICVFCSIGYSIHRSIDFCLALRWDSGRHLADRPPVAGLIQDAPEL